MHSARHAWLRFQFLAIALSVTAAAAAQGAQELAKLTAADAAGWDQLGQSVAVDGDTVVVGATVPYGLGRANVFVRTGDRWTEQARLNGADAVVWKEQFGAAVDIDGDTVVVGAPLHRHAGVDSGAAYVFVRSGSGWTQQQELIADDAAATDYFGDSVAISGDTIVVGAIGDDGAGSLTGAAYVFVRSGTSWSQQAKLSASDASVQLFGTVAIDGDTVVVGASHLVTTGLGSAYVFTRSGGAWREQAKLTPGDPRAGDGFGESVAIDGDTALVGASTVLPPGPGKAYVFTRSGGLWSEQARLTASAFHDKFGRAVALDGDRAVIGAPNALPPGAAYLFTRAGTTWTARAQLTVAGAGRVDGELGTSVAMAGDTVIAGAPWDDSAAPDGGAAYVFGTCAWFTGIGTAVAGSDWFEPRITGAGCTVIGNGIDVEITSGLGGAMGCFVMGVTPQTLPFLGGTVLVVPIVCLTHVLDGVGSGNGTHTFALRIPNDAGFVGAEFLFQGFYADAGAVQGVSMTVGLRLAVQ